MEPTKLNGSIVDVIVDVNCTEDNLGGTEINIRRNRIIFHHLILVSARWAIE